MTEKTYTRDDILRALNDGADLVLDDDQLQIGERETDLVNLVVNAAMSILDDPTITLDEVMEDNYDGGSATVRSWWDSWS